MIKKNRSEIQSIQKFREILEKVNEIWMKKLNSFKEEALLNIFNGAKYEHVECREIKVTRILIGRLLLLTQL